MAFHLTRLPEMTAMVCAILERPATAATTETAFGRSASTNGAVLAPALSTSAPFAPSSSAPSSSAPSAPSSSVPSASAPSPSAPSASAPSLVEVVHQLADADLEALLSQAASGRAEFDRVITVAAGEAAKRSERALGHGGLAQRRGHRTVIQLVQSLTGESKGEAARQVKVGELIGETDAAQRTSTGTDTDNPSGTIAGSGTGAEDAGDPGIDPGAPTQGNENAPVSDDAPPAPEPVVPWQYPVTAAIMTGTLSTENGHLILRILDAVSETCSTEVRRAAATELVDYATRQQGLGATLHEDLLRRARQVRDRIDPDGIAERFTQRYERRSVRTWHDRDGALNLHAICDDDSGVFLTQLFDLALSPRRGGPRFTTKDDVAWAQRLLDDPRSNEQLAFDTLLTVLHDGAACNTSTTFRTDRPAVRVITVINTTDTAAAGTDRGDEQHDQSGTPASVAARNTSTDADRRHQQHGQLEGSAFAVPHTVVEATVCTDGVVPITVDRSGRALNLGRTRRLFSPAQRVILRARDGGCLWPGCDRPPWQTEAHHIDNYAEHHGRTDIADGVSLCKFHHLNLHNNHWHIRRRGTNYELIPPTGTGLAPIPLHPKSTTWEHVRQCTG